MGAPRVEFPYGSGGGGGGGLSGGGTPGALAIWTGPTALGDSPLSFSGSTLTTAASLTTIDFSAANQSWRVPNTAFALEIGATGLNPTLKVQANLRYLGVDSPSSPADKLHIAESGPLAFRMQNVSAATYWQHKVDASGDWGLAVNGGTNAMTAIASTGNVAIGTTASATANSRLTVAGGFIATAAGFGVYQAGDHLTLSGGAGKNVHLKPNDGGVLAVNVGATSCDMTAVAGYILTVGGPVRATGTSISSPAFTRHDAATTGMYFPGANEIGFTTGSGAAMYIGASSATPSRPVSVGQASGMSAQLGVYRATTGAVFRLQNGVTSGFADCLLSFNAANTATTTQDAYIDLITNGGVAAEFMLGSSAAVPMTFRTGGVQQAAITSGGNFQFNSGYGSAATAYGTRAWVNFDGTAAGTFAGGASTVTRVAGSTTATVTTTSAHGLITGNTVVATSGVAAGSYTVTVLTSTTFTITTVATTALTAVAITFQFALIRGSGGIGSVAKHGTGEYAINLSTAMPDANYAVNTTIGHPSGSPTGPIVAPMNTARGVPTTACFNVYVLNSSFATTDATYFYATATR